MSTSPKTLIHFGPFTANPQTGELWKNGLRVRMQTQPFEILKVLLDRPNEIVTREELQKKLWPSDTFVDFDQGLNKAVNKLRDTLSDTVDAPKFIETIPKRGYRFIAAVVRNEQVTLPSSSAETAAPAAPAKKLSLSATQIVLALVAALFVVSAIVFQFREHESAGNTDLRSIAVMPFTAEGSGNEYDVADGLTDTIISDLSLVPGLRVISHASVFQYRNQPIDPQSVGQRLGVASLLTGRVSQSRDVLTIKLELIGVSDGRHLWGQEYSRNLDQSSAISTEVAGAVADVLRLKLSPGFNAAQKPANAEAHQLYLKGRYYFFRETPEDVLHARDLFREAIDKDPSFALAYSALGDSYDWMATEGIQPAAEVMPQSMAAKTKANSLDTSLAEVHASLGSAEFVQWDWPESEVEFQQALRLNPNYFEAHRLYSIYLRTMKRYPEAVVHAKLCDALNPLLLPAKSHLALTYYFARDFDAAAAQYQAILKDDPKASGAHAGLAAVLFKQGKEKEGVEELQRALALEGDQKAADLLGRTYSRKGLRAAQTQFIQSEIETLKRLSADHYVSPVEFASRYAQLDEKDLAFHWLDKAYDDRSPQLFNLGGDPDYDNLRADPRFNALIARLHLPQ